MSPYDYDDVHDSDEDIIDDDYDRDPGDCDEDSHPYPLYDPACDDNDLIDGVGFADPGGNSSLRAATKNNPRDRPCPTCGTANVLTRIDVQRGYQCNRCADRLERGGY